MTEAKNKAIAITVAAGCLALAIGIGVGYATAPDPPTANREQAIQSGTRVSAHPSSSSSNSGTLLEDLPTNNARHFDWELWDAIHRMDIAAIRKFDARTKFNDEMPSRALLFRWCELDPDGAIRRVMDVADARRRYSLGVLGETIARFHPQKAREFFASLTDEKERNAFLGGFDNGTSLQNRARVADLAPDAPPIRGWFWKALSDPQQAAELVANEDRDAKCETARAWALVDPDAAIAWAKTLPEKSNVRAWVFDHISDSVAQRNLPLALELADQGEFGFGQGFLYSVSTAVRENHEETIALIEKMNPSPLKDQISKVAADALEGAGLRN